MCQRDVAAGIMYRFKGVYSVGNVLYNYFSYIFKKYTVQLFYIFKNILYNYFAF